MRVVVVVVVDVLAGVLAVAVVVVAGVATDVLATVVLVLVVVLVAVRVGLVLVVRRVRERVVRVCGAGAPACRVCVVELVDAGAGAFVVLCAPPPHAARVRAARAPRAAGRVGVGGLIGARDGCHSQIARAPGMLPGDGSESDGQ